MGVRKVLPRVWLRSCVGANGGRGPTTQNATAAYTAPLSQAAAYTLLLHLVFIAYPLESPLSSTTLCTV